MSFKNKSRLLYIGVIILLLAAIFPLPVFAVNPQQGLPGNAADIQVFIDGEPLVTDVAPILEQDRTLVPLRVILEALGATVEWIQSEQSVTATKDELSVKIQIGSKVAFKNGQQMKLEVPPRILEGRTLVPLRFVSEALGASVEWDGAARKVIITSDRKDNPGTENVSDKVTFVAFGDCAKSKKPYYNENVMLEIIEGANSIQHDFVMFLGDGTDIANLSDLYNLKNVFSKFNKPLYVTVGNHDIEKGGIDGKTGENNFFEVFKDNMISPHEDCYYSFAYKKNYFIVLNSAWQKHKKTEHKLQPGYEQWQWLEKQLDSAIKNYTNTIVFTHMPPLSWNSNTERKEFYELMSKYDVKAVFSGHLHEYRISEKDSTKYVISGGAGSGGSHHFLECTVSNDQVQIIVHRI